MSRIIAVTLSLLLAASMLTCGTVTDSGAEGALVATLLDGVWYVEGDYAPGQRIVIVHIGGEYIASFSLR